jgi:hypothetical protein
MQSVDHELAALAKEQELKIKSLEDKNANLIQEMNEMKQEMKTMRDEEHEMIKKEIKLGTELQKCKDKNKSLLRMNHAYVNAYGQPTVRHETVKSNNLERAVIVQNTMNNQQAKQHSNNLGRKRSLSFC